MMSDSVAVRTDPVGNPQAFLYRGGLYVVVEIQNWGTEGRYRVKGRLDRGDSIFDLHCTASGDWTATEVRYE